MNIQNPPRAGRQRRGAARPETAPHAEGPPGRSQGRSPRCSALLGDRSRRRDLLIEHLHLIQDKYGHISGRAHRRARRRDEAVADRGLRGRDLLRAFRRGEGRRDAAAAGHGARLRLAVLRDGGRRAICSRRCRGKLGPNVRVVRAPCMGACDRAPVCAVGHVQVFNATPDERRQGRDRAGARARLEAPHRFRALPRRRRLSPARRSVQRQAHARRSDQDRQRRRPARPRRRGLSDRPQVVARARRAGAAADGGQRRRGRARHLQGPLLPRARSAPLPRRHADRRLGGRGGRHLHLHPRRISRAAADARRRDRQGRARRPRQVHASCICAAAPAPTSAAKSRR